MGVKWRVSFRTKGYYNSFSDLLSILLCDFFLELDVVSCYLNLLLY